jgi:hypothetical protein
MPRPLTGVWIVIAGGLLTLFGVASAAAQGKSGQAPAAGKGKPTHPGGGPPVTQVGTPTPASASLQTWLDDASPIGTGNTWVSLAGAEWRSDSGREIEAPITSVLTGVAPRLSLGASVPAYHFDAAGGGSQNGIGDVPIFAKLVVVNPADGEHHVGLAVTPLIDVSNEPVADGASRVTWAVPVSVEVRGTRSRVYASGGYFSSGAVFGTAALEVTAVPRVRLTATLGESYATSVTAIVAGASRHRIDASVSAAVAASRAAVLFVAAGHAFSGDPALDGGPWVAGGVAFRVSHR